MTTHERRHLTINLSKICRHKGGSFPNTLAYITRSKATNPRTGVESNYQSQGPIEAAGFAGWEGTRHELIANAVFAETLEKVVEGRHLILALPHEFGREERLESVETMAGYLVKKFGVAVVFAIHPPSAEGDQRNWHSHLIFTSRRVEGGCGLGKKTRELDSIQTGGGHVESLRSWWCAALNSKLIEMGCNANLEHRSFERLGIDGAPTRHKGERRTAIERAKEKSHDPVPVGTGQKLSPLPENSGIRASETVIAPHEITDEVISVLPSCPWPMNLPPKPEPKFSAPKEMEAQTGRIPSEHTPKPLQIESDSDQLAECGAVNQADLDYIARHKAGRLKTLSMPDPNLLAKLDMGPTR